MNTSTNGHWTAENIPDLTGKVAIVTGANSGIGYETAKELAVHGAETIMACRSMNKGQEAIEAILKDHPAASVVLMHLDLADLEYVRQFAHDFMDKYDQLDILVNNAGVMALPKRHETAQGFEVQFGTNHLGHFALTGLLMPLISKTPNSRVVTVSSAAHIIGRIRFDDLQLEQTYDPTAAYGQSKLANMLFTYQLHRLFERSGNDSISLAAHPGWTKTNLQRHSNLMMFLNQFFAQKTDVGALPTLYAATADDAGGGEYYGPRWLQIWGTPVETSSSARSQDEDTARRLWQVSEELTGVKYHLNNNG